MIFLCPPSLSGHSCLKKISVKILCKYFLSVIFYILCLCYDFVRKEYNVTLFKYLKGERKL